MRLPKLEGKTGSTELNRQFLGYRHVDAPDEGAFYEMENVTSERYPLMAPRSPRAKLYTLQNPGGLCAKTALAWTENGKLYYGGEAVADVSEGEKTFVSMGAWLIVFPDGVRYNTADGTVDAIGQKNVTDGTVNFTLCEADGTAYSDYTVSETEPEDTTKYWLCTGSDPHCLKKYSAATKLWNTVPTTYVMISAAGIGKNLAEGDTVTVSGVLDSVGADLNGEMLLQQAADDAVVVVGFLDETASQTDAVTLERKAPKLDYVVECNNRLWGCSSEENEIYACKLGDATNWNCFAGLATDSYTVSVGSDGPFTGAAVQLGYVLFFKENCLHKVYGSKPSNFQVSMTACEGVQPGSAKSLCMVGSTLYYKADHGVMAYDGSVPESVSAALGGVYYQNAVAVPEHAGRGGKLAPVCVRHGNRHLVPRGRGPRGGICDAERERLHAGRGRVCLEADPGGRGSDRGAGALDGRNRDAGPVCAGCALHQPAANPAVAAGGKPVCGVGAV